MGASVTCALVNGFLCFSCTESGEVGEAALLSPAVYTRLWDCLFQFLDWFVGRIVLMKVKAQLILR